MIVNMMMIMMMMMTPRNIVFYCHKL